MGTTRNDLKRWQAVLARDRRFDGSFVYAVRSTGVYCCPSCPSRRPHRRQVVFFSLPAVAERAGFRPCKRCHPRTLEALLEKGRMEEELKLAADIQHRLRPAAVPKIDGWELAGLSFSCREIGGDYYDFIERPEKNRIVIALGDVAGKGVGAALLMASLHAAVRAESRNGAPLSQVMREINRYIFDNTATDKFLTLFYAVLDPATGMLEYSNAGHLPPLLARRSGEVLRLDGSGLPIGVLAEATYPEQAVRVEPGDALIVYTDGLREATRDGREEFGESRLVALVQESRGCSAAALCQQIDAGLADFLGGSPPMDDRALVVVKRVLPEGSDGQESDRFGQRLILSLAC